MTDQMRRRVLAGVGSAVLTTVAGCVTDSDTSKAADPTPLEERIDDRVDGEWLQHRATATNAASTAATGPASEPEVAWNRRVGPVGPVDPLVVDSLVFEHPPDDRDVGTLEVATGERTSAGPLASDEFAMGSDGETMVAARAQDAGGYELLGRDVDSGDERWTTELSDLTIPILTVRDGVAYLGGATQPYGRAFDLEDGDERWESEYPLPIEVAVSDNGVAYAFKEVLGALDVDSGDQRWLEQRDSAVSTPLVVGGHTVTGTAAGSVLAFEPTGESAWERSVAEGSVTTLAAAEGQRFVGTEAEIVALDAANGEIRTRSDAPGEVMALSVGAERCYAIATTVEDEDDPPTQLVALETDRLETVWSVEVPGDVRTRPVILEEMVLVRAITQDEAEEIDVETTLFAFS